MYTPLPKNKKQLLQVVEDAIAGAQRERNIALIEWYIIHYYMQGVRLFTVRNWEHGDVQIAYENSEDELTFRWEHVLVQFRVALGRYSQVDITPSVEPSAYALSGTRDAAVAYATLNFMLSHINKSRLKSQFLQLFLKYGTVGLRHQRVPGRNLRERTSIWIIPPWELLCYPAEVQTLDSQRGLWHSRKVPLAWLKTQEYLNLPDDDNVLKVEYYPYGSSPDNYGILDTTSAQPGMEGHDVFESPQSVSTKKTKDAQAKWVQVDEGWIFGDRENEVREYVVRVGRHIAAHEVHPETNEEGGPEPVLCPISIARHTDTGRFYGRGEMGPLIGINDQVEKMLSRQFQIVSDQDEYGCLLVPTTSGINMRDLKKRERRKIIQFEPDPLSPHIKPEVLAPYSSGDQAGKLVNFGVGLQDKIAGTEGGMFGGDAPGRVDSAAGLGFLHQTSNVGLIGPSNNIGDCFRGLYRSILAAAREEVSAATTENPLGGLDLPFIDDRMVGLVLDPKTGKMSLTSNSIPHPNDVVIDIADREPTNASQAIQEAKEQMQMGNMTYTQFIILNFQKNWGLPVADRSKWEAYRKAVYLKIVLFHDGEEPGEIPFNVEADDPEVTLIVIKSLMSSLEFLFASDTVRAAFEDWKLTVELGAGARYPQGLPLGEDQAEIMDAQAGPGPGPPQPGGPLPGGPPQPAPQGLGG